MKPLKMISSIISYAIFIWLLLIGALLLVYIADIKIRAAKGDNTPPTYNAYVVLTGSMVPEIMPNDVVITKKKSAEELQVGDIITFVTSDPRLSNIIVILSFIISFLISNLISTPTSSYWSVLQNPLLA